jgi:excisionase family DNA binding protein
VSGHNGFRLGDAQAHLSDARDGALVVEVALPVSVVEAIAECAAELVLERLEARASESAAAAKPYLRVDEAAAYLGARSRQRVDDLLSQGRLSRVKDGRRTLIARAELDAYLAGEPTGRAASRVAHPLPSPQGGRIGSGVAG